jgi:hypothetical protein
LNLQAMELYELMNINRTFQSTVMKWIEYIKRGM